MKQTRSKNYHAYKNYEILVGINIKLKLIKWEISNSALVKVK